MCMCRVFYEFAKSTTGPATPRHPVCPRETVFSAGAREIARGNPLSEALQGRGSYVRQIGPRLSICSQSLTFRCHTTAADIPPEGTSTAANISTFPSTHQFKTAFVSRRSWCYRSSHASLGSKNSSRSMQWHWCMASAHTTRTRFIHPTPCTTHGSRAGMQYFRMWCAALTLPLAPPPHLFF